MGVLIAIKALFRFSQGDNKLMLFLSSKRIFKANSMLIIYGATILIRLRRGIIMSYLCLMFLTSVTARRAYVRIQNKLILMVATSMRVISIGTGYRLLISISKRMKLRTFFAIRFTTNFMMNGVNMERITINRGRLIKAYRGAKRKDRRSNEFTFLPFRRRA